MCKAVVETGEGNNMAEGINGGILYLMAFPYVLVGIALLVWYKRYKVGKKHQ